MNFTPGKEAVLGRSVVYKTSLQSGLHLPDHPFVDITLKGLCGACFYFEVLQNPILNDSYSFFIRLDV